MERLALRHLFKPLQKVKMVGEMNKNTLIIDRRDFIVFAILDAIFWFSVGVYFF